MKRTLIRTGVAVAALLAAPFAAPAADFPSAFKAPAFEPVFANWTGFYVGLNGGYGFGRSDWDATAIDISPKGAVVGGTIGYNLQTGIWLWGVEGDVDWSNIKGDAACGAGSCEAKNTWLATARARIGYAGFGGWLPYITGGAAGGDIKAADTLFASADKARIGWTAGLGFEYAMWASWSVKAEYLYVDLGSFDCGASCGAASDNVGFRTHLVRAGVNYRF